MGENSEIKEIYELGERPPIGIIPKNMHAFCVRQERFGEPNEAWKREIIPVPEIGPLDVLVYTMATGINYNNVWAGLGFPVDVIADRQKKGEPEDFHAGGSDSAGIIWAVEDQLFGQVMQKFGTLVEKSRVILVTLGYEELSFLVSASRTEIFCDSTDHKAWLKTCTFKDPSQ